MTALLLAVATACATVGLPAIAATIGMLAPALYVGLITRRLGDPALERQVYGTLGPPLRARVAPADWRPVRSTPSSTAAAPGSWSTMPPTSAPNR